MRLLIIEDDKEIADLLRDGLTRAGYTIDYAPDGATGLAMTVEKNYGLIVLDLMLPQIDGWRVCEELRARRSGVLILMLCARDGIDDRVRGLDAGADDYMAKPFAFPEFLARVRALVRRDRLHKTRVIHVGDLEIDTAQRRAWRAGSEVILSHREYELLEALAAQEGRVLSRETIQERVWMNEDAGQATVAVYIGMLRKKIDAGHEVKLIHTVHGAGYKLRRGSGESDAAA